MVKVFINPGHGGKDPGAVGNGLKEKDVVLKIAKEMRKELQKYNNVTIKMFRSNDTYYSLSRIAQEANKWGADIFVSIHVNAGGGTGFETFIYNKLSNSSTTAKRRNVIHDSIAKVIGMHDRGKKKKNLSVLRETKMSGILTENGFIDSKSDSDKMKDNNWIVKVGQAHALGVAKVFNLEKEDEEMENNEPDKVHEKGWKWLIENGITNGKNPRGTVTRQQFATMLHRYHNKFYKGK